MSSSRLIAGVWTGCAGARSILATSLFCALALASTRSFAQDAPPPEDALSPPSADTAAPAADVEAPTAEAPVAAEPEVAPAADPVVEPEAPAPATPEPEVLTATPSESAAEAAPEGEGEEKEGTDIIDAHGVKVKWHDGLKVDIAGFHINGRFDLAYEVLDFAPDSDANVRNQLQNYHHFVFITRNNEDEPFSVNVEIIDLTFYELGIKLHKNHRIRFGKIMVPFGRDPLFHKSYGGLSGFDQKLLPPVWAELGASYDATIFETDSMSLDNQLYFVAGFAGTPDQSLNLNGGGNFENVAVGDRARFSWNKLSASLSFYGNSYADGYFNIMSGFDFTAARGFLPWPYIDQLAISFGVMRADMSDLEGFYYHFGSYLELDYLLPYRIGVRYRTGSVTTDNKRGLFFDDRPATRDARDTLAHSFTVWRRFFMLTVSAQYIINVEAAGEIDNDLFRITAAMDF